MQSENGQYVALAVSQAPRKQQEFLDRTGFIFMVTDIEQIDLHNLDIIKALFREAQMAECFYRAVERDEHEKHRPQDKKTSAKGIGLDEIE